MIVGFIGLGKMGRQIVFRLLETGHRVVGYNRTFSVSTAFQNDLVNKGLEQNYHSSINLAELLKKLPSPRNILFMVTAGPSVDEVITDLLNNGLTAGDCLVDMGNSYFRDSQRRYQELALKKISFIDCGTSGGLPGAGNGASLMLGGDEQTVLRLTPVWDSLAVSQGWIYAGSPGAGHYVKMVHNSIEYGMNQAIAEGFALLEKSPYHLNLPAVAGVFAHGSVIRGWLMELLTKALVIDPKLSGFTGRIGGGETGKWAKAESDRSGISCATLEVALAARERSLKSPDFAGKVVSALRAGYGGHQEPPED
jgi:6-phosphogluconate dehydrogenase